ncbi:dihydroorotase [Enterococcus sp. PF1-24]|uniref:amidohydrolase/deacetylase family metallohydrolase n=1 Tax=unclassified Enterococcus TaxID=2608891 RepID=UPI002474BB3A|nr:MULTISPECIES: amidohydrolase/deacetylase family metallohydrolase [unclassified Enterococcus]MDH6363418.1 dihydroorotase [Enterococcus sp. PFB1-1]MDH6400512.1 dihydroorotase [Enterococcus sp. PF1-24]
MFDLLIKNARTITGEKVEVAVTAGKIVEVAPEITAEATEVLTLADGQYLSAGWIDDHVHCFEEMELYYDYPDEIGVEKGVTTVIDAGTTGAENVGIFYKYAVAAKTNVYALVNISKTGIVEQDELADLSKVRADLITKALKEYPDFIIGIKARMSKTVIGDNGMQPLILAKEIQKENADLPLMVHIGSNPPELVDILTTMTAGDVLTHCFNGKPNGILDQATDKIKDFVWEAYDKGVVFDIGHGTDSFNFHVAEVALAEGMKAHSISTDIYIRNRTNGPVYDLATTLEKLHLIGYSWEEIIEKITEVPAEKFNLTTKGRLAAGFDGDFTIFELAQGEKVLTDSNGNQRTTKELIQPVKAIIGGKVYDC